MQAHGFCHRLYKMALQIAGGQVFMAVVYSLLWRIVWQPMQQVANIVQQSCCHQSGRRGSLLCQNCGLQCMLGLAHRFTAVGRVAMLVKELKYGNNALIHNKNGVICLIQN